MLLCGNAAGHLIRAGFIYKAKKPRAFKGRDMNQLPVFWMHNRKAWTTSDLFLKWFHQCFLPEVKSYLHQEGLEFKIMLLLDNAPGHPQLMEGLHGNVEVMFLPPNTTNIIQPLDQGIIATFKALYLRKCMKKLIHYLDRRPDATVKDFWKAFNIKDAVDYIVEAWDEVLSSCMNGCWSKIWPEVVNDFTGFPIEGVHHEIVAFS